jgi:ribosomal 50S subunit-associated protein YjgA (DUF615 family)
MMEERLREQANRAAVDVLRKVESRRELLVQAGEELVTGFLAAWSRGEEIAALEYLRLEAAACEVIEAMRRQTRALTEETKRRRQLEAELIAFARELGAAGVKLLLAALLAA